MDNINSNASNYDPSSQAYYSSAYFGVADAQQGYQDTSPVGLERSAGMFYPDAASMGGVYPQSSYGNEPLDSAAYFQQQTYDYGQPQQQRGGWDHNLHQHTAATAHGWNQPLLGNIQQQHQAVETTEPGSFFVTSEFVPRIFGYPVGALAYDSAYAAMYVASTTQSISSTRYRSHRASMLVTHSSADGMLYSSVAGHPEASPSALQATYQCMYGVAKTAKLQPTRQHVPSHAYRPPYGSVDTASTLLTTGGSGGEIKHGHIGINSLVPLKGYVASVSPSAVRIHSHGGLQLYDHDIEGMVCGTIHPNSNQDVVSHISVGGIPHGESPKHNKYEVHCMDVWQGLRIVSSRAFKDGRVNQVGVTAMAASHERGSIVAGCSDGNIRILDGSLRELASVKSHLGGVSSVAVAEDGNLIATAGYGSRSSGKETSVIYAFPDPTIFIYDLRYLGRGGMPHPFTGLRGSPRFLSFLPDIGNLPTNRLLVGSGQPGGGLQIIVPFEAQDETVTSFILPQLEQGESISAMEHAEGDLALGTSAGRVLQYRLAGYDSSGTKPATSSPTRAGVKSGIFMPPGNAALPTGQSSSVRSRAAKQPLEMPPFVPPVPPVSLDPNLLHGKGQSVRNGPNEKIKSLFSAYILQSDPKLSFIGNTTHDAMTTFGSPGGRPIVGSCRRAVAHSLINQASKEEGDFLVTVPTSKLEIDLLSKHGSPSRHNKSPRKTSEPFPNPNKLLYTTSLSSLCYDVGLNQRKRRSGQRWNGSSGNGDLNEQEIPKRYRLQRRPGFKASGAFQPGEFNECGLFPGWNYAPTLPNAFASPVLLLLYFFPEVRAIILEAQYDENLYSSKTYEKALAPELGFIFHQIECLSRYGLLYPSSANIVDPLKPQIGAFVPSNFLTALSTMPEAEQLQIVDGSPAAVDPPRRPEAFFRFLAYHLDKELSKQADAKIMDPLLGIDFVSINQFVTGSSPSSESTTRALTVDLAYESFTRVEEKSSVRFGEVLQQALCRETRLRAWNQKSKAYETIVQRKIATTLPRLLTLSCSCAGRKEEDGLWVWRADDGVGHWLPEIVEVEIEGSGNVIVKELQGNVEESGKESWATYRGKTSLSESISKIVSNKATNQKIRYRLEAVLSFIRDSPDPGTGEDDEHSGHHVLHARVSREYKKRAMKQQLDEVSRMALHQPESSRPATTWNADPAIFRKRAEHAGQRLATVKDSDPDDWVLFNGFVVSKTEVEDAKAFHVAFKEPCLVVYRAVEGDQNRKCDESEQHDKPGPCRIPLSVMNAQSLAIGVNCTAPRSFLSDSEFAEGTLVAFDAEFVSVQEEEATLTETGSKVTLRETRHALARISVLDCDRREVILDDYVLPKEGVVDYLTRFSGIVSQDLDPAKTTHNLISTRSAYLKLRYLMEQGCIFVGHGLRQDFATVNLAVPPHQILDTVEIFFLPGMRYLSLRFLANHVLGRDMQQDTHDSVEDAMAAFELYEKALEWKSEGVFDQRLQAIYESGQKTDWKIGVEDVRKQT